jgi:multicomponent Na+:H+ antiporter subunit C
VIVLAATTVAILFGAGTALLLRADLLRLLAGTTLLSSAIILFIQLSAPAPAHAPVHPIPEGTSVSDPLVQALALTALVINFAVTALLLVLVHRAFREHGTIDPGDLGQEEDG